MAYYVYIACDKCGTDMHLSCNSTYSMTRAIEKAKRCGWKVKRIKSLVNCTDFICPECARSEDIKEGENE